MTPTEQRIAIAEACGFSVKADDHGYKFGSYRPDGTVISRSDGEKRWLELRSYPDYLNDLNAMAQAEEVLTRLAQQQLYVILLLKGGEGQGETMGCWHCLRATAAQRAEAFLRTVGKWKD